MLKADNLIDQHAINVERGSEYDDGCDPPTLPQQLPLRLIAFYLPQFHAIPENDEWWGPGFTEWTNVTKALPRFPGHYQPRLPGALGFYDLTNPETLRRQAEMATQYGIEGFCFHHYWFAGHRLLERPLQNLLDNPDIPLPFCINWANENWTRTWDGSERSVLIGQNHSPEDDLAFARSLEPMFDDSRYIRIGQKPLLMVYRPGLLPDARATVERWREHFARRGHEIFLVMAQTYTESDPMPFGMDAAVGFPPHKIGNGADPIFPTKLFDAGYNSHVFSYDDVMLKAAAYRPEGFRMFPGLCPDWDNEARRPGRGHTFVESSPQKYGEWLESVGRWICSRAPPEERFVFVNAWNEWAEGAYLEPDRHYGFAYLAETGRTLARLSDPPRARTFADRSKALADFGRTPITRRIVRKFGGIAARVLDAVRSD